MLKELKKRNNKNNRKNIILYTFLFIFFLLSAITVGEFENIKPLQINSISDFVGNDYRRVEFKLDLITDYYLSIENEKDNQEIGIGYLAYDEKSNKRKNRNII